MKLKVFIGLSLLGIMVCSCSKSDPDSFDPNSSDAIEFKDNAVAKLCIENFDLDGDNRLSYKEAASVVSLKDVFRYNQDIYYFNELKYFVGLKSIFWQFYGCRNLREVTIPNNVENSHDAFAECSSLSSVMIQEGLRRIDAFAFSSAGLKSVVIPASVSYLGGDSFEGCESLKEVTILAPQPPENDSSYIGSYADVIYVPSSSVNLYKEADGWRQWSNKFRGI